MKLPKDAVDLKEDFITAVESRYEHAVHTGKRDSHWRAALDLLR